MGNNLEDTVRYMQEDAAALNERVKCLEEADATISKISIEVLRSFIALTEMVVKAEAKIDAIKVPEIIKKAEQEMHKTLMGDDDAI